jgi:hypothetical protein
MRPQTLCWTPQNVEVLSFWDMCLNVDHREEDSQILNLIIYVKLEFWLVRVLKYRACQSYDPALLAHSK